MKLSEECATQIVVALINQGRIDFPYLNQVLAYVEAERNTRFDPKIMEGANGFPGPDIDGSRKELFRLSAACDAQYIRFIFDALCSDKEPAGSGERFNALLKQSYSDLDRYSLK